MHLPLFPSRFSPHNPVLPHPVRGLVWQHLGGGNGPGWWLLQHTTALSKSAAATATRPTCALQVLPPQPGTRRFTVRGGTPHACNGCQKRLSRNYTWAYNTAVGNATPAAPARSDKSQGRHELFAQGWCTPARRCRSCCPKCSSTCRATAAAHDVGSKSLQLQRLPLFTGEYSQERSTQQQRNGEALHMHRALQSTCAQDVGSHIRGHARSISAESSQTLLANGLT